VNWGIGWGLDWICDLGFWGNWSEKGSTRKCTGNWVASWTFVYLGEFRICAELRRNWIGGIGFGWELVRLVEVATGGVEEGGTTLCFPPESLEEF
jgi:hypothetical protein